MRPTHRPELILPVFLYLVPPPSVPPATSIPRGPFARPRWTHSRWGANITNTDNPENPSNGRRPRWQNHEGPTWNRAHPPKKRALSQRRHPNAGLPSSFPLCSLLAAARARRRKETRPTEQTTTTDRNNKNDPQEPDYDTPHERTRNHKRPGKEPTRPTKNPHNPTGRRPTPRKKQTTGAKSERHDHRTTRTPEQPAHDNDENDPDQNAHRENATGKKHTGTARTQRHPYGPADHARRDGNTSPTTRRRETHAKSTIRRQSENPQAHYRDEHADEHIAPDTPGSNNKAAPQLHQRHTTPTQSQNGATATGTNAYRTPSRGNDPGTRTPAGENRRTTPPRQHQTSREDEQSVRDTSIAQ